MRRETVKVSDLVEEESLDIVRRVVIGVVAATIIGLVIYLLHFFEQKLEQRYAEAWMRIAKTSGALMAAAIVGGGIYGVYRLRKVRPVPFECPYCGKKNLFAARPVDTFVCEHCNRTVGFHDGELIPVNVIVCEVCRTRHKVAANVLNFTCDRCNRPLKLHPDAKYVTVQARRKEPEASDELLQNFDVLIVAYDHRKEAEVAFKVQDLLLTNMKEARRLLVGASTKTPLIVSYNQPERKADAIRRTLQEQGATATLRPTTGGSTTNPAGRA